MAQPISNFTHVRSGTLNFTEFVTMLTDCGKIVSSSPGRKDKASHSIYECRICLLPSFLHLDSLLDGPGHPLRCSFDYTPYIHDLTNT